MSIVRIGFVRSLILAFAIVLAALMAAGSYTWVRLESVAQANRDAAGRVMPQLARMAAIELNITRVSLLARHAMLVQTPEDLKATFDEIGAKRTLIDAAVSGFEQNVRSQRGKELFAVTKQRIAEF